LERSVVADLLGFVSARRPVALKGEKNAPGLLVEPISTKNSALVSTNEGHVSRCYPPSLRLLIVGATHVAQVLCPMARMLDYLVTVVDPRAAFAQSERWKNVPLETLYPDEWIQSNPLDKRTAVVTLSHDPKIDDPGLEAALKSPAFYVGALGSRRTHAARLARLTERGFNADDLARIHGPVGLDLGAETPSEIATAIAAELTRVLRKGDWA
jgi:xanthine dehydrogenase accessory factor